MGQMAPFLMGLGSDLQGRTNGAAMQGLGVMNKQAEARAAEGRSRALLRRLGLISAAPDQAPVPIARPDRSAPPAAPAPPAPAVSPYAFSGVGAGARDISAIPTARIAAPPSPSPIAASPPPTPAPTPPAPSIGYGLGMSPTPPPAGINFGPSPFGSPMGFGGMNPAVRRSIMASLARRGVLR